VSFFITSTCRVITSNIVVSSFITSKYRVLTSNRVSCRRSLHQRVVSSYQTECRFVVQYIRHSVWCDDTTRWCNERQHDTLVDVMTRYFDVMSDDTTLCLMWWHDTLHYINVSCHHIKQNVVSSLITSTCRVITSTRVSCCRSLHQRIVSSHQTECRVVDHYINVSCHHIKQNVALM
jgi:hypothetical protein